MTEEIYKGKRTVVYRGYRQGDNLPVVIKVYNTEFPSPKDLAKFRREYEIGTLFNFDGVIRYYSIERYSNVEALISEDFGAI